MCLSKIDKEIKTHRVGYKVFLKKENSTKLKTPWMNKCYPIKKWIVDDNEEFLSAYDEPYRSGFHYYLNKESALSQVGTSGSYVVYKILVRKKVCTGVDASTLMPCGVSREIFIKDQLIKKYIDPDKEKLQKYKKFKGALKVKEIATLAEQIYKAEQKHLNLEKLYKEYFEVVTQNLETFCEWITFVDHFSRRSIRFHSLTTFHSYALKNFPKHQQYYRMIAVERKFIDQPHIDWMPNEIDF